MTDKVDVVEVMARAIWTSPMEGQPKGCERREWPPEHSAVRKEIAGQAHAAIQALREAGYAIVPVEPSHDITAAVVEPGEDRKWAVEAYLAMITAAQGEG